jgi:4-hydroxy-2-oxoheptanedioate aldolase
MRANAVKKALKAGRPVVGTWLSLGNIVAARFLARSGLDYLTVDVEHTLVNWETTTHMLAAIADAGCTGFVRVPANKHDHIKRALDNGAQGIVVPMVNTRQEALDAVAAAKYPPAGTRSVGGSVHALNFATNSADYFQHANDEIAVVLQCEHIQAVEDAEAIFSVPGIDAIFVGPNDLAASMRSPDGRPPSAEATQKAMAHILATCRKHGVPAGVHTFSAEEALDRIEEGWQFLAISSELKFMLSGVGDVTRKLGGSWARGELARY